MEERRLGATEPGRVGEVYRVAGPVVTATGISPRMYDVVNVGEELLMGEVIQIVGDKTIVQVYEDTSGIKPGERVEDTGAPLVAELGPGLLGSIYDGVQRPLPILVDKMGDYIKRGVSAPGLPREKKWKFVPTAKMGDEVVGGQAIGSVQEAQFVKHKILVPPRAKKAKISSIREGSSTLRRPSARWMMVRIYR